MENFWQEKQEWLNKLTLEDAKFIFEQAEKSFNYTIETANKIYERTNGLLTLVSGILIGLTTYVIGKWKELEQLDNLLFAAVVGMIYFLIIGLMFVQKGVAPKKYMLPGTYPKVYFNNAFFSDSLENKDRILRFYIIEFINFQDRIDENTAMNKYRGYIYTVGLRAIFFSPIVMGGAFAIAAIAF